MIFRKTKLAGAFVIELEELRDDRGFYARAWCQREFEQHGLVTDVVQTNMQLTNRAGSVRGLHWQTRPHEEAKFVRCIKGALYDVIIDLREDSPTYKHWIAVELSAENRKALYVPGEFAHGYQTLQDDTEVIYQVSAFYSPDHERGVRWNDPTFAIEWPQPANVVISKKDQSWPDYDG